MPLNYKTEIAKLQIVISLTSYLTHNLGAFKISIKRIK
jgi:hypothetical protein